MAKNSDPVKIKKYTNRRLYNTETSTYVTLDDLAVMVKEERDFVVVDAKSGKDLTHSVLTQIILEQESKGQNLMPVNFLRQLIRFYGHGIEKLVPSYLELSLDSLTREQDRYASQFGNTFTGRSLEAMQEQTRKNMALFEQAMSVFSPFAGTSGTGTGTGTGKANAKSSKSSASGKGGKGAKTAGETDELSLLREQLSAMQKQLDTLTKSK
ncbi:MAG: polyhydroxyalkanoate synthesis repressor PhaR [Hyphomicrobiaceae bacterium]